MIFNFADAIHAVLKLSELEGELDGNDSFGWRALEWAGARLARH